MSIVASPPPIHEMMGQIIEKKRTLLQEKVDTRFQGTNLLKEAIYVTSDVGTAGFSMVQGVSLLTKASHALKLVGSVSGLIGGVLNIGQGLFLLTEALQALKNGQKEQGKRLLLDGLLLIGIGLLMTLASLSILGIKLGALSGAAAVAANPYVMPILFLCLVLPGLTQTLKHIAATLSEKDLGSRLNLKTRGPIENEFLTRLQNLTGNQSEEASAMLEEFCERLGVEAGIEAFELLKRVLNPSEEELIEEQAARVKKGIAKWNRMVKLRVLGLALYALMAPLGIVSGCIAASAAKVVSAVSKFFLTAPSSLGAYMDLCEPFNRNGAITVRKVLEEDLIALEI